MHIKGVRLDFGPLEGLLADDDVLEVMVNGHDAVYVERAGQLEAAPVQFQNEAHVRAVIDGILHPLGYAVDAVKAPIVDARLPDGSRVHVVIPPIAATGPTLVIRKPVGRPWGAADLVDFGSWDEAMVTFLRACVQARCNVVVSGSTGSGKTTVLNILVGMIPADERIIAIQNQDELHVPQKHVIKLDTRLPDAEGKGEVTVQDLVISAQRMRPDRIVLGEAQGGEIVELLQAMNTGHDGTLVGIHASSPANVLARLEGMATMHPSPWPLPTIRQQLASAIHLITHQEKMADGRRVLNITEVTGLAAGEITTQDIFAFVQTGFDEGNILGYHTPTGAIPACLDAIRNAGIALPDDLFTPIKR